MQESRHPLTRSRLSDGLGILTQACPEREQTRRSTPRGAKSTLLISPTLSSGALYVPRHPTTSTKDIDYTGNGQTTLSSANWQWLTPLLGFNESSKREYPGNPVAIFIAADDTTKSVWGENGEWAKVNGVVMAWESGVAIKSSYP